MCVWKDFSSNCYRLIEMAIKPTSCELERVSFLYLVQYWTRGIHARKYNIVYSLMKPSDSDSIPGRPWRPRTTVMSRCFCWKENVQHWRYRHNNNNNYRFIIYITRTLNAFSSRVEQRCKLKRTEWTNRYIIFGLVFPP